MPVFEGTEAARNTKPICFVGCSASNCPPVRVKLGQVVIRAIDNLLVGKGKVETACPDNFRYYFNIERNEFELAVREDYRLSRKAKLHGGAMDAGMANGQSLMPDSEYLHPRQTIRLKGAARNPGALQSVK